jgi:valyl-tRNA synthetase
VELIVVTEDDALKKTLLEEESIVRTLGGIAGISFSDGPAEREGLGHGVGDGFEVFLSLAGLIDVDAERTRLGREVEKTRSRIDQLNRKLENPAFLGKAPPAVVEKSRNELDSLDAQLAKLTQSLAQLHGN